MFLDDTRPFTESSFIKHSKVIDDEYILFHYPTSTRPRNDIATITMDDWEFVDKLSEEKGMRVLVISDSDIDVPLSYYELLIKPYIKYVVDLVANQKTTIKPKIEKKFTTTQPSSATQNIGKNITTQTTSPKVITKSFSDLGKDVKKATTQVTTGVGEAPKKVNPVTKVLQRTGLTVDKTIKEPSRNNTAEMFLIIISPPFWEHLNLISSTYYHFLYLV